MSAFKVIAINMGATEAFVHLCEKADRQINDLSAQVRQRDMQVAGVRHQEFERGYKAGWLRAAEETGTRVSLLPDPEGSKEWCEMRAKAFKGLP